MRTNVIIRNKLGLRAWWVIAHIIFLTGTDARLVCAQVPDVTPSQKSDEASDPQANTMFPETVDHGRLYVAGQMNFIYQTNPAFYATYSGPNSFQPYYQKAASRVLTFYSGYQFSSSSEALLDVEEAGGQGLSQALGIAGFVNLDAVRNPTLGQSPYFARLMFHHVIALSDKKVEADPTPLSTFSELPARRLELRTGK